MFESYLDSTICSDDSSVSLHGYNLICADHPKNIKQRGVWVHYREILLVKAIQTNDLPECLVCEVNYENKKKLLHYIGLQDKMMMNLMSYFAVLKAQLLLLISPNHTLY